MYDLYCFSGLGSYMLRLEIFIYCKYESLSFFFLLIAVRHVGLVNSDKVSLSFIKYKCSPGWIYL